MHIQRLCPTLTAKALFFLTDLYDLNEFGYRQFELLCTECGETDRLALQMLRISYSMIRFCN